MRTSLNRSADQEEKRITRATLPLWSPNHLCGLNFTHGVLFEGRVPNQSASLPVARSGEVSAV